MPVNIAKTTIKRKAFTVAELTVVVALLSVFSIGVMQLFMGATKTQTRATDDLRVQTLVLAFQNEMIRLVREGREIIVPVSGQSSPLLMFADKINNVNVLFTVKDEKLSEQFNKDLYKLMLYRVDVQSFNPAAPSYNAGNSREVANFIERIRFTLTNVNTVNISALFSTDNRQFETMFEAALMNYGDEI